MSPFNELSTDNFKRINSINWILTFPLAVLFSWPYYAFGVLFNLNKTLLLFGTIFFAIPFIITILHGHVTLAIGHAHRHLFYDWLEKNPYSWGLMFHKIMISTRFRLAFLAVSTAIFFIGYYSQ